MCRILYCDSFKTPPEVLEDPCADKGTTTVRIKPSKQFALGSSPYRASF